MEVSLGDAIFLDICGLRFVEGIGVQCLIGNYVILQESLEILLTMLAEEKGIDTNTKLLKCEIRWCKDGPAQMGRRIVDGFE